MSKINFYINVMITQISKNEVTDKLNDVKMFLDVQFSKK
jgi:hypothetical protein